MKIQIEKTDYGAELAYYRKNGNKYLFSKVENLTDEEKCEAIVFLEMFANKIRKML